MLFVFLFVRETQMAIGTPDYHSLLLHLLLHLLLLLLLQERLRVLRRRLRGGESRFRGSWIY